MKTKKTLRLKKSIKLMIAGVALIFNTGLTWSQCSVDVGQDISICQGNAFILTALPGDSATGTYLWSTAQTTQDILVNPNVTTTYTVTFTDLSACSATDEVVVIVSALPTANAGADLTTCGGYSVTLTATGGITYQWGDSMQISQSIVVSPNVTTTYYVTVTEANGCIDDDAVVVTILPGVTANAGADQYICVSETATLTASGGTTYLWSTAQTTSSITVNPTETTVYTVTVTSGNGCTDKDEVTVILADQIIVNAGEDMTICNGESTWLQVGDSMSQLQFIWNTGATTYAIFATPVTTTTYTVTATDGCSTASDEIVITVENICCHANFGYQHSGILEFTFSGPQTGNQNTYSWNFGDGGNSAELSPIHTYNTDGFYNVCLNVYNIDLGDTLCSDSYCIWIGAFEDSLFNDCEASFAYDIIGNYEYQFYNTSFYSDSLNNEYFWDFGDGSNSNEENPVHVFANDGVYEVCLGIVSGIDSCTDYYCENIFVGNIIPNDSINYSLDTCVEDAIDTFFVQQVITNQTTEVIIIWAIVQENDSITYLFAEYHIDSAGVYYITLTINCAKYTYVCGKLISIDQEDITTGIKYIKQTEKYVSVYPNPATDNLNIDITTEKSSNPEVQILNSFGQVVYSEIYTINSGQNTVKMNISELPSGIYFVRATFGNESIIKKFVK